MDTGGVAFEIRLQDPQPTLSIEWQVAQWHSGWILKMSLKGVRSVYQCPTLIAIAVTNTVTKGSCQKKGLPHWQLTSHQEGKSRQKLKTGAWRQKLNQKPMEDCCSPWLVHPAFLIQGHLYRGGKVHKGWALPHQFMPF